MHAQAAEVHAQAAEVHAPAAEPRSERKRRKDQAAGPVAPVAAVTGTPQAGLRRRPRRTPRPNALAPKAGPRRRQPACDNRAPTPAPAPQATPATGAPQREQSRPAWTLRLPDEQAVDSRQAVDSGRLRTRGRLWTRGTLRRRRPPAAARRPAGQRAAVHCVSLPFRNQPGVSLPATSRSRSRPGRSGPTRIPPGWPDGWIPQPRSPGRPAPRRRLRPAAGQAPAAAAPRFRSLHARAAAEYVWIRRDH